MISAFTLSPHQIQVKIIHMKQNADFVSLQPKSGTKHRFAPVSTFGCKVNKILATLEGIGSEF